MLFSRSLPAFGVLQGCLAAAIAAGLWLSFAGWQWSVVENRIHREYPQVRQMEPAELATLLDRGSAAPVLLDVRQGSAYKVSHLPGAQWVASELVLDQIALPPDRNALIVSYSDLGERSAAFADRLRQAGYSNVFNLRGSIVRWANEGRPLTDGQAAVSVVEVQDHTGLRLLKKERRARASRPRGV